MGIMLYPGLMDPDMAGEAERRSPPSSRGQDITTMLVTTLTNSTSTLTLQQSQVFNTMEVFLNNDHVILFHQYNIPNSSKKYFIRLKTASAFFLT